MLYNRTKKRDEKFMIYNDIKNANTQALKDHDKVARTILTVVFGKLKDKAVELGCREEGLADGDSLNIIKKTIKELDEELEAFKKANRPEKVEELETQKNILAKFLPKMMSEDEIRAEIEKLEDKSIPVVMKHFKANFNGLCDMGLVSKIAKEYK